MATLLRLLAAVIVLGAFLGLGVGPGASEEAGCDVVVTFEWEKFEPGDEAALLSREKSWSRLLGLVKEIVRDDYRTSDDEHDSRSFLYVGIGGFGRYSAERRFIVFDMQPSCDEGRAYLGLLFDKYKRRLTPEEARIAPMIAIVDESNGPVRAPWDDGDVSKGVCHVLVTYEWPSGAGDEASFRLRDGILRRLAEVMIDNYTGDYDALPIINGLSQEQDYTIFNMRSHCDEARTLLRRIFDEYKRRLRPKEASVSVIVVDTPVTKYEGQCGLGATAATCPVADKIFPD